MSNSNFLQLPPVTGLTGAEWFPLDQLNASSSGYTTSKALVAQIVGFSSGTTAQSAHTFYAGPTTGGAAPPTFRAIVNADIGVARGGTGTATQFTAGSIVFAGASGVYTQDNANLFWDDTNNRLGVGTATPDSKWVATTNLTPASIPAPTEQAVAHIAGNETTNARLVLDAFASWHNSIIARSARGTTAAPAALQAGDTILNCVGRGFDGSAYTAGGAGSIAWEFHAWENWTPTATSSVMLWRNCAPGTTTTTYRGLMGQGLSIESHPGDPTNVLLFTDPGVGNLLVQHSAGIGTTAYIGVNSTPLVPALQVHGTTNNTAASSVNRWSADASGPFFYLTKSRGASVNTQTVVQSGDTVGGIDFRGSDGTNFIAAARITAQVDGTPGTNDMPGRMLFGTTADGASTITERLRIDNAGNVIVNTAAIATNATDGFLYLPTSAGQPTGTPTSYTGRVAHEFDTTNNVLAVYNGGWRFAYMGNTNYAPGQIAFVVRAVDFNSANTDNAATFVPPAGFTRYIPISVRISHASASLTTATCGVFTQTAAGGTAIVSTGTAITVATASESSANNTQALTIATGTTESFTTNPVYFRVQTAQGSAATADVTFILLPVS